MTESKAAEFKKKSMACPDCKHHRYLHFENQVTGYWCVLGCSCKRKFE